MSTTAYRLIEVKRKLITGKKFYYEDLLNVTNANEGDIYEVVSAKKPDNLKAYKFYKFVNGQWVGQETCETKWELLTAYTDVSYLLYNHNNTEEPDDSEKYIKTVDGETLWGRYSYYNVGMKFLENYLSSFYSESPYVGRGIPEDADGRTKKAAQSEYTWGQTYIMLNELSDEMIKIQAEFQKNVIKRIYERQMKSTDDKLKQIISMISDVQNGKVTATKKAKTKSEEEETEWYEDTVEYLFEDYLSTIRDLSSEIDIAKHMVDISTDDYIKGSEIRLIYYCG